MVADKYFAANEKIMKDNKDYILSFAKENAVNAGKFIRKSINSIQNIEFKGDVDMVTDVDKKAQELIIGSINKAFPDHDITAEENRDDVTSSYYRWIIDPIDGTTNFVHGYPRYCVSIALEYKGKIIMGVVYDPCLEELFSAFLGEGAYLNRTVINVSRKKRLDASLIGTGFSYSMREKGDSLRSYMSVFRKVLEKTQGIRRDGSAALDLCYVACGRFEGFFEEGLKEWDIAAGVLIVQEANGKITDFFGKTLMREARTMVVSIIFRTFV